MAIYLKCCSKDHVKSKKVWHLQILVAKNLTTLLAGIWVVSPFLRLRPS
jgi:hypothetical protein